MTQYRKYQDAYPVQDGGTYAMVRLVTNDQGWDESGAYVARTEEMLRVETAMLDEDYTGQQDFEYDRAGAEDFKTHMGAVVSDAIDAATGERLPGRQDTRFNVAPDGGVSNFRSTRVFVKNGKAHSVELGGQKLLYAIASQINGKTTLFNAVDGKYNDHVMANDEALPAKIVLDRSGQPEFGEHFHDGVSTRQLVDYSDPQRKARVIDLMAQLQPEAPATAPRVVPLHKPSLAMSA